MREGVVGVESGSGLDSDAEDVANNSSEREVEGMERN